MPVMMGALQAKKAAKKAKKSAHKEAIRHKHAQEAEPSARHHPSGESDSSLSSASDSPPRRPRHVAGVSHNLEEHAVAASQHERSKYRDKHEEPQANGSHQQPARSMYRQLSASPDRYGRHDQRAQGSERYRPDVDRSRYPEEYRLDMARNDRYRSSSRRNYDPLKSGHGSLTPKHNSRNASPPRRCRQSHSP